MAVRIGTFGRPKTATNYSATIESLMRSQQATEWTAIQDAYSKGGTYDFGDGKGPVPVTDSRILQYMTDRRDEIGDPKDPEWQAWNNNVTQQKFTIAEDKVSVAYKEGKMSEAQVADWYRGQLANYSPDSAIYRTIEAQAATFDKAAAAQSAANAGKVLSDKLNADSISLVNYNAMSNTLTQAAITAGYVQPGKTLADAKDPAGLQAFINQTRPGGFSWSDYASATTSAYSTAKSGLATATQAGDAGQMKTWQGYMNTVANDYLYPLHSEDGATAYWVARDQWQTAITAANGNPAALAAANQQYAGALNTIIGKQGPGSDPTFVGDLRNELTAVTTGKVTGATWAENAGYASGDAAQIASHVQGQQADAAALANGSSYYGRPDGNPTGPLGTYAVPSTWTHNPDGTVTASDSWQVQPVTQNGVTTYAHIPGGIVYQSVLVDRTTGLALTSTQLQDPKAVAAASVVHVGVAGYQYFDATTGKVNQYATIDPGTGKLIFTSTNPFLNYTPGTGGTASVIAPAASGSTVTTAQMNSGDAIGSSTVTVDPNAQITHVTPPGAALTPGYIPGSDTFHPEGSGGQQPQEQWSDTWTGGTGATTPQEGWSSGWVGHPNPPTTTNPPAPAPQGPGMIGKSTMPFQPITPTLGNSGANKAGQITLPKAPLLPTAPPAAGTNLSGDLLHIGAPTPTPLTPVNKATHELSSPFTPPPSTNGVNAPEDNGYSFGD